MEKFSTFYMVVILNIIPEEILGLNKRHLTMGSTRFLFFFYYVCSKFSNRNAFDVIFLIAIN